MCLSLNPKGLPKRFATIKHSPNFLITKPIAMKLIYCLMIFFCPLANRGQKVKPLTVGDRVPDTEINNVYNYPSCKIQLSALRGKLVILDFWASWCSSCINGMPASDSLQKQFKGRLQILLVNPKLTGDSLLQLRRTLHHLQLKLGTAISLPVVLFDTNLYSYFPFHYLPHLVWIGRDGRVKAITGKEDLTYENILAILEGKHPALQIKVR